MQAESPVYSHPLAETESGKAWFRGLPQTDPKAAVDAISSALAALPSEAFAGAGAEATLRSLETLRKPFALLQDDLSARYADKALPLSETQRAAFDSNIALSGHLASVYRGLIPASLESAGEFAARAPLIHQRVIFWMAQGLIEHLRARQRFPESDWEAAQEALQSAGRHQLLESGVRDSLQPGGSSSVAATYSRALLLTLCGARSLGAREFECARELAHHFEAKAELSYIVADSKGVAASAPKPAPGDPVRTIQAGTLLHFIDIAALSKSLRRRYDSLAHGKMFDAPVLTAPPAVPALKVLFSKLHSAWCSRSNQRQFPRRRNKEQVYAAFEPAAIYALMKRRSYVAPAPPKLYDHHEVANIYLRQGTDRQPAQQAHTPQSWDQAKGELEIWQAQEQSATGMSLIRLRGGARVRQGQLVALRLGDAGVAMVGVVRWAEQGLTGAAQPGTAVAEAAIDPGHTVEVGVQMLPGLARAGAVRYSGARAVAQAGSGKAASTAALILDNFTRAAPRAGGAAAASTRQRLRRGRSPAKNCRSSMARPGMMATRKPARRAIRSAPPSCCRSAGRARARWSNSSTAPPSSSCAWAAWAIATAISSACTSRWPDSRLLLPRITGRASSPDPAATMPGSVCPLRRRAPFLRTSTCPLHSSTPSSCASSPSPTASSSRRCASTARSTAAPPTGT